MVQHDLYAELDQQSFNGSVLPDPRKNQITKRPTKMNDEIQSVINDAFLNNSIKQEADDPLVAVLVMQRRFFNETVNNLLDQTTVERAAFLTDFKSKADEVIAAVEKAEKLRKEMVLEVLQSNEDTILGIEEWVQGSVSA